MPLFDLNNLEHTACTYGCGPSSGPFILLDPQDFNVMPPQPQEKVINNKLTREDFNQPTISS